jgi:hypothetical protein
MILRFFSYIFNQFVIFSRYSFLGYVTKYSCGYSWGKAVHICTLNRKRKSNSKVIGPKDENYQVKWFWAQSEKYKTDTPNPF